MDESGRKAPQLKEQFEIAIDMPALCAGMGMEGNTSSSQRSEGRKFHLAVSYKGERLHDGAQFTMRVKRLLRVNSEWTLAGVGNLQRWSIPLPFFWFFHLLSSCRVIAVRQDHSGTATSGLRLYSKTKRDLEKWCLQPVDRLSPICSSEQFQKKDGPISNSFCLRACLCGLMPVFPYFHLIPFLYMLFPFLSLSKQGFRPVLPTIGFEPMTLAV